ncbi:phage baseplate protein [Roseixanthobacter pseudopolyaromaticivorans]|uniref:phage baseplate protein n=1 Tax=Xanthobacteraceae TaxID=335928 RepID=UPI003728FC96
MMVDIVEAVIGTVSSLLLTSGRSIGGIVPDVVAEEIGRDTTFVTNHPVERGAAISDHAFMMPVEVEMRCAWSDSTAGFQGYSELVYGALQSLQAAREPFTVLTGKRLYTNMLIVGLEVTTAAATEYALFVRVLLREVIIVSTQSVSVGGGAGTQASPPRTTSTTNAGSKQTIEVGSIPTAPGIA